MLLVGLWRSGHYPLPNSPKPAVRTPLRFKSSLPHTRIWTFNGCPESNPAQLGFHSRRDSMQTIEIILCTFVYFRPPRRVPRVTSFLGICEL